MLEKLKKKKGIRREDELCQVLKCREEDAQREMKGVDDGEEDGKRTRQTVGEFISGIKAPARAGAFARMLVCSQIQRSGARKLWRNMPLISMP
jgi:hypothetical protein